MKQYRKFLTLLALCVTFSAADAQIVSYQRITKSFAQATTDTLWFSFPVPGFLGLNSVAPDTGSASYNPPDQVRWCRQLKFTYKKVAGATGDELRVKLKCLGPDGVVLAGDSVFVVGTASTFSSSNTDVVKAVDVSDSFDLAFGIAVIVTHNTASGGVRRYQFDLYSE